MKITDIKTQSYAYPVEDLFGSAGRWTKVRNVTLVFVKTDEGITGIGESDCAGGPPIVTATIVEHELKPKILGMDPFDVERIWRTLYDNTMMHGRRGAIIAAISGIDIGLWDIMGKTVNKPIYKLLGGARDQVMPYASQGFYRPGKGLEYLAQETNRAVESGYKAIKMKIGKLSIPEDIKRIREVRRIIGDDILLFVDGNSVYSVKEALRVARHLEELNVYFFEEPVSPDNIQGSAQLAAATSVAIAGYETEYTRYGFRNFIDARAIDIAQPSIIRVGGITEGRRIAAYAGAHHLPVAAHMFSSGISFLANLHFIAGVENGFLLEFEQNFNPLRTDILAPQVFQVDGDGLITLPQGPGLGVEIDLSVIEKYRVRT